MKFRVFLHKRARKFLEETRSRDKERIVEKLRKLEDFPEIELDVVKVVGEENTFRLRIGSYRALFRVYENEKIIVIAKIDTRKRIYR
ncbi:MAG: type II toxin-antitoxin system RelE/ParE family toxin [Crenarchaeota archaeon]|nr:type II toxin-antitoxin system RelE/ParE family toxin [Thermoproteota archaeon]